MKYFVISDIHSYYDLMIEELNKSGFDSSNPEHILISLGDNIDRGDKPFHVIKFLMNLFEKNRAILIRGNHEDLLEKLLRRGSLYTYDEFNGTFETVYRLGYDITNKKRSKQEARNDLDALCSEILRFPLFKQYLDSLIDYFETDAFVFTHGFIPIERISHYPVYNPKWRNASKADWEKARFYNGIELSCGFNVKIPNKTIVVGHFHTSYGHVRKKYGYGVNEDMASYLEFNADACFDPYYDDGIIAIDACTAYTKKVNVLVLDL